VALAWALAQAARFAWPPALLTLSVCHPSLFYSHQFTHNIGKSKVLCSLVPGRKAGQCKQTAAATHSYPALPFFPTGRLCHTRPDYPKDPVLQTSGTFMLLRVSHQGLLVWVGVSAHLRRSSVAALRFVCGGWGAAVVIQAHPAQIGMDTLRALQRTPCCILFAPTTNTQSFTLPSASMWWVRFAVSLAGDVLVAGNGGGKVFLWDPSESCGGPAQQTLSHKGCTRVVGGGA
jgi:hypothetical protein